MLDAHADRATVSLDGKPVGSHARLRRRGRVLVQNGAARVETVDVRTQAALPTGLPDVESSVWQPGTPGLDEIITGHRSGEVVSRRTLIPAGPAMPNPGRVIALTFDDGPSPDWTPLVLEILRRFAIKATFCTVGYNQRRHPELADAAQALELGGVDQPEQQRVRRPVQPEGDHVVDRVADDLLGHGRGGGGAARDYFLPWNGHTFE